MRLKRAANAKRNLLFGTLDKAVSIGLPFLIRTVMIREIGARYLGLDSLFTSILQVLSMTELGFGNAMMCCMYRPIAENDTKTLCAILQYYRHVYRIVGVTILLAGAAVMPFLPRLIRNGYPAEINLYLLYGIYLANTAVSYLLFAYKSTLLAAYQRQYLLSNIRTVCRLCIYSIQIAALLWLRNYYAYALLHIVCSVCMNLGTELCARRLYPSLLCEGVLDGAMKKEIATKVKGLTIGRLCQMSRNSFDSIFISAFLGLTATAMYSNYYYVIKALNAMFSMCQNAVTAGIGNSVVLDSREKNYREMTRINFVYMWAAGWCTVCLLCLYQPFMRLFFGAQMAFPFPVAVLFVVYFYALKLGDIRTLYVEAVGLWWENRYRATAEATANLLLNYLLGRWFGIYGIIAATLISLLAFNFCWGSQIIFRHYFTNTTPAEYFRLHLRYAAVICAVCALTYRLTGLFPRGDGGVPELLRIFGVCAVVPNALLLLLYKRTRIYREAIGWLGRAVGLEKYGVFRRIFLIS